MRKLFLILMAVVACAWSAMAQNRTISGIVIDAANNEPLIGATVMPNGGGQGTATDIDGNFTLSVPANVKTATVSYVGYKSQTVDLKDGMTVHLASESTTLDDVVVVAYGTATKESLTGSVAVVGAKEIEDRPVTSATAALEGNAPGVQVNSTTGQPGDDASIVIRGIGSVTSSTAPLIVVDGMQFNGAVSDINPQDIESMSVLKDAASCALYGNKGANGVILITTKRAKKRDKIDVNLTVRQGIYHRGLPEYERLGVNQWMETTFAEYSNFLMASNPDVYPDRATANAHAQEFFVESEVQSNIYNLPSTELFGNDGKLVEGAYMLPGYTDLDWWDAISRTGYRQEYNLSAAAASEKYNVFASVGYLKENGYIHSSDYERFTGRINANFAPTTYFNFGINLNATTQESQRESQAGTGNVANPFSTQYYSPVYPYYQHDEEGNIMYDVNGDPIFNTAGYLNNRNVALELRKNYTNYKYDMIDATVYGTAVIPYGFELKVTGNLNRSRTTGTQYTNNIIGDAVSVNGRFTQAFSAVNYYTFMQHLTWSHEYGKNLEHHVDVLLAHENYGYRTTSSSIENIDQQLDDMYILDNFPVNNGFGGSDVEDRAESYLARARYDYNQQYFAEASIRRDGSSRFHPNHRWGNFWSVGASWIISKEKFMQQVDWISYLKLRAAYGAVGNNAGASAFAYKNLFAFTNYAEQMIFVRSQLAREDVSWESTNTLDIALEGSLFRDRLRFTVVYFDKRSADLLFDVTLPASVGTMNGKNQSVLTNIGTMSNRGWEIGINGDIIRTKDFLWTAGIDATFIKNKVVKLPEGNFKGNSMWLKEGHERYAWYLYEWAGVDELTGKSLYYINPESEDLEGYYDEAGNPIPTEKVYNSMVEAARQDGVLVEYNGKHYTTSPTSKYATRNWAGTSLPTVYGSVNTALSWKGINLSLLFTYGLGGKTLDSNYISLMNVSNATSAVHVDALNSWTGVPEGMTADDPNRINPDILPQHNRVYATDSYNSYSTRWLVNSSYLVFKNLNLSYDLPMKWVAPLQMQRINLGVSIDNLFTVTARKGMNPQQSMSGGQGQTFGTARVFSFQLNVQF